VPLRAVNWSWSGTATNGSSGWTLLSGTNSINPPDFDVQQYPFWNSNVKDDLFIPPL
jgi:hypothetical protein